MELKAYFSNGIDELEATFDVTWNVLGEIPNDASNVVIINVSSGVQINVATLSSTAMNELDEQIQIVTESNCLELIQERQEEHDERQYQSYKYQD